MLKQVRPFLILLKLKIFKSRRKPALKLPQSKAHRITRLMRSCAGVSNCVRGVVVLKAIAYVPALFYYTNRMKNLLILLTIATLFSSCLNNSEYKATVNEVPEPTPLPDSIMVLPESSPDSIVLTSPPDSLQVAFMTIGLGRGYGWYEILFFKDSCQRDTIKLSENTTMYNSMSLRQPVRGKFGVVSVLGKREHPYYWRVWYRDRNIKSNLRAFFVK